jgi:THO complex subunit 2
MLDRHPSRHGDRRDGRDSRLPDARGLDRPGGRLGDRPLDRPGDRSRDFSGSDRRAIDANPRDFGSSDRTRSDRDRVRPDPPPRWTAESARENFERSSNSGRGVENGRLSRDMPPPRASASERGPSTNSDRQPLVNPERQELINPERAAWISGEKDTARSDSPRRGREETRDRVSSRPQSPRRHVSEKDHSELRRDDRPLRNGAPDPYNSLRSRPDDVQPPPAGPRSDRPLDRTNERGSSDRSAFQPAPSSLRSVDPDHGRLNSTPRQQGESTFGRLNPAPTPASTAGPDIPSGPRDRNNRTGRNPPPPRQDRRTDGPRPPTPEKQPPTGPSSRNPRRSASGQFDQVSASQGSAPSTPVAASSALIHPDRLKQLGSTVVPPPPPAPAAISANVPIYPDRQKALESPVMPPPAAQQNNNRGRPPLPPVATGIPPSGPKGSQPSPGGLGTNGLAAPTGPASATERAARGGRRQLAGIQTMLQQAGQQNVPDRNMRRGRMSSGIGPETPIASPSIPAPPPPPPGPPPARADALRDAPRAIINPERADLITGNTGPAEERDRDRNGRRERSGHHSRRGSRSPGRERDSKRGVAPEEDRTRSDYRDRRDPERDRHAPRSPARDLIAGRDAGSGRESGRDRERERERDGSRRDGRERDAAREPHETGWTGERGAERGAERGSERGSGRSREIRGDVRGDERRDSRSTRDDGARKRHSEEGMDSRGREKRPRR